MLSRREMLAATLGAVAGTCCAPRVALAGWPSSSRGGSAGSAEIEGCQILSSQGQAQLQPRLLPSCGDPNLDQAFRRTAGQLSQAYGVRPGLAFMNDPSPNALATHESLEPYGGPDGTVIFGVNLVRYEIQAAFGQQALWNAAILGILAHEWVHIFQFKHRILAPNPRMELFADFVAGTYLGATARYAAWSWEQVRGAFASFFGKGDYQYNDPSHHGTPAQRVNALDAGVRVGAANPNSLPVCIDAGRRFIGI